MYFVCQEKQWFWPKALWFCEGLWANQKRVLSAKNCVFHSSRILKHWFLTFQRWMWSSCLVISYLGQKNWVSAAAACESLKLEQSETKRVVVGKDCDKGKRLCWIIDQSNHGKYVTNPMLIMNQKQLGLWISDVPFLGPFIACQTWWHHTIESTSLVGWKSTKHNIYI